MMQVNVYLASLFRHIIDLLGYSLSHISNLQCSENILELKEYHLSESYLGFFEYFCYLRKVFMHTYKTSKLNDTGDPPRVIQMASRPPNNLSSASNLPTQRQMLTRCRNLKLVC
jgi:hypothetical protein